MAIDPPPAVYVAAALVALFLTVREARQVLSGDRRARPGFAFFLPSAAVLTILAVRLTLIPQRPQ